VNRPPVDVRRATVDDTEDLLLLWAQAREEIGGTGRTLVGMAPDAIRPRLQDALAGGDVTVLLARWEGRPAGYAVLRVAPLLPIVDGSCVHVEHLYVAPALRRRGAGRALLHGVASVAERHGADQVVSNAQPTARETHRFLARLGFTPLVVRRVAPTAVLRRRLAGESRRGALEDLLSRRRSMRARTGRRPVPEADSTPAAGVAVLAHDLLELPRTPPVRTVPPTVIDLVGEGSSRTV